MKNREDYKGLDSYEILNLFRNKYYTDEDNTENGIVANAINAILPGTVNSDKKVIVLDQKGDKYLLMRQNDNGTPFEYVVCSNYNGDTWDWGHYFKNHSQAVNCFYGTDKYAVISFYDEMITVEGVFLTEEAAVDFMKMDVYEFVNDENTDNFDIFKSTAVAKTGEMLCYWAIKVITDVSGESHLMSAL